MTVSNKKLLEAVETIGTFCEEQSCCKNCILQSFCADGWNCCMMSYNASELSEAMAIYPYHPLKEKTGCLVSQKEHTVIVEKEGCTVTTL